MTLWAACPQGALAYPLHLQWIEPDRWEPL
jgi:hypothetical protein